MSILPVRPLARPSPPLDRLAAEGDEQRSQTGWIGVQEWVVIFARALSAFRLRDPVCVGKGDRFWLLPSPKASTERATTGLLGIDS